MDYRLLHSDGTCTPVSIFQLKDLYDEGKADLRDIVFRDGKHWLVGEIIGQALGSARFGVRGVPVPMPPSISWSTVAIVGGLTGGYGLGIITLLYGLWSRRLQKRVLPVLLPLFSLLAVPMHLLWDIHHLGSAHHLTWILIVQMILGLILTEALAVLSVTLASLSVRQTLLNRLGKEGFQMNLLLTVVFGPSYLAYKLREIRETAF